jgi:hypothetical protein
LANIGAQADADNVGAAFEPFPVSTNIERALASVAASGSREESQMKGTSSSRTQNLTVPSPVVIYPEGAARYLFAG